MISRHAIELGLCERLKASERSSDLRESNSVTDRSVVRSNYKYAYYSWNIVAYNDEFKYDDDEHRTVYTDGIIKIVVDVPGLLFILF